jgi:hypothetical protein
VTEEIADFASQFFAPEKPPRDDSGRPLLVPRGQEILDSNRVAYTRASGLGDILEEFSFLWKWKMRGLAKGLADSMDLIRLVAAENYTCGFAEDEKANRAAGRNIDGYIERAMDRAGVDAKADYGTAIHLRTEPGTDAAGSDPDEKQHADAESCWALWREMGVVHLGTEVFTANDVLRSAGTFDHLSYVPGLGIVVTDKKTSSKAKSTYDIQLANYANADVYDPDTDERQTLEEYIASKGWDPALINREVGIIWWIKNGRTQARELDLVAGWRWAQVAARIRDERRTMGVARDNTKHLLGEANDQRDLLRQRIQSAQSVEELTTLWSYPAVQAIWTDEHTQAAKAKREAL